LAASSNVKAATRWASAASNGLLPRQRPLAPVGAQHGNLDPFSVPEPPKHQRREKRASARVKTQAHPNHFARVHERIFVQRKGFVYFYFIENFKIIISLRARRFLCCKRFHSRMTPCGARRCVGFCCFFSQAYYCCITA
jgi:hypothetical protein